VSQRAIGVQLEKAEEYYLSDNAAALAKSRIAKATDWVNAASGVLFVVGISLTTAFVIANFERGSIMSNDKKGNQVLLNEGAPIPKIQEVPLEKGVPIPNLQQVPQNQSAQSPSPAQSTPTTPPAGSSSSGGSDK
jgi:hypothetical protein